MKTVSLTVSTYMWTCPECGITHEIDDPDDQVTCEKCGETFETQVVIN